MLESYDLVVVGAGPAGMFCAYEAHLKNPKLKILLVDKGANIYNRKCPIMEGKLTKCPDNKKGYAGCYPGCAITNGFGGAGAYSDGKYNITSEFGGWMTEYLSNDTVLDLIKYADSINLKYGATEEITNPQTPKVHEIERRGLAVGLKLLRAEVRHLGTENNINILKKMYEDLDKVIDMEYKTLVTDFKVENSK